MPDRSTILDITMASLRQMETMLEGLKQLRKVIPAGTARNMLDSQIKQAESQITEIKRKVIQ